MVEIKAELLKWCKRDHKLHIKGNLCTFISSAEDPNFFWVDTLNTEEDNSERTILSTQSVLVNPQEYEEAVIARIKEMFTLGIMDIEKNEHGVFCNVYTNKTAKLSSCMQVPILADPRPWEESYTIEIGE